jgi:hypothetical protein
MGRPEGKGHEFWYEIGGRVMNFGDKLGDGTISHPGTQFHIKIPRIM